MSTCSSMRYALLLPRVLTPSSEKLLKLRSKMVSVWISARTPAKLFVPSLSILQLRSFRTERVVLPLRTWATKEQRMKRTQFYYVVVPIVLHKDTNLASSRGCFSRSISCIKTLSFCGMGHTSIMKINP